MAKAVRILPIIKHAPTLKTLSDSINQSSHAYSYGSYSWYHQMVQTSYRRLARYNDFDMMDEDGDVARALNIIADEIVGTAEIGAQHSLEIDVVDEDELSGTQLSILQMALRIWIETVGLDSKMYHLARNMIKYGDVFFIRSHHNSKWIHVPPRMIIDCIVDKKDGLTPLGWNIKADGSDWLSNILGGDALITSGTGANQHQVAIAPSAQVIRFSTNHEMSQSAPFGESMLTPAIRAFKEKRLIEEAVIIYRVQRAPERRVFYIDVGSTPLPIRAQVLETIKNEIKQKKVPRNTASADPTENSGYDKVFDPLSTNEDYFFPISAESRGSRVETLPGGANVGEVADLDTWRRALWRALQVPHSYIDDGSDGAGLVNDGKTGVAYIQELNFNMMIQRLQQQLNAVFDLEFKRYLRENDIVIDSSKFRIRLPVPQNFAAYRQQALDSDLLSNYSTADGINHISKRYGLSRFLQMTPTDILENERSLREELGLDPDDESIPVALLYDEAFRTALLERAIARYQLQDADLSDVDRESGGGGGGGGSSFGAGDFGVDLGDGDFGGDDLGGDDLGGDAGDDFDADLGGDLSGGDDLPFADEPEPPAPAP